jgi:hypothetical protein
MSNLTNKQFIKEIKALLKNLSNELTKEFGKGFSVANLKIAFKNRQTVSSEFKLLYIFIKKNY